ncbi:MAG: hypothetical protein KDA05_03365, partial [Phycisphaerales bacterium]|nr:hypothetical protein [Phycisphaerales bacterium]
MRRHALCLFAAMTLLCTALPVLAQERLPIEWLMRQVQARADPIRDEGCSSCSWRSCGEGPAPDYPPDGYYGDLPLDPAEAEDLVESIHTCLEGLLNSGYYLDVSDLSGAAYLGIQADQGCTPSPAPVVPLTLSSLGIESSVSAGNYERVFWQMASSIERLRYLEFCWAFDCGIVSGCQIEFKVEGTPTIFDVPTEELPPGPDCGEDCEEAWANALTYFTQSSQWETKSEDVFWNNCVQSMEFLRFELSEQVSAINGSSHCTDPMYPWQAGISLQIGYLVPSVEISTSAPNAQLRVYQGVGLPGLSACNPNTPILCPGTSDPCHSNAPACNCDGAGNYAPGSLFSWSEAYAGPWWHPNHFPETITPGSLGPNLTTNGCPVKDCCENANENYYTWFGHVYMFVEILSFDTSPDSGTVLCEAPTGTAPNTPAATEAGEEPTDGCAPCGDNPEERQAGSEGGATSGQGDEPVAEPCDIENGAGTSPGSRPTGADPIDYESGAKLEHATDLVVAYTGRDFRLTRRYVSTPEYGGAELLGHNWIGTFAQFIEESGSPVDELRLHGVDARQHIVFTEVATDVWRPDGATDQYIEPNELTIGSTTYDVWRLVMPGVGHRDFYMDGTLAGLLVDERDMFGNGGRYTYAMHTSTVPRLERIDLGHTSEIAVDDPEARVHFVWTLDGKLESVWADRREAQGGRPVIARVAYRYHDGSTDGDWLGTEGDLIQVTTRTRIDAADAGEPFRTLVTQYRYHDESLAAPTGSEPLSALDGFDHQLKMVIAPEQIEFFAEYANSTVLTSGPQDRMLEAAEVLLGLEDDDTVDFQTLPDLELYQLASKLVGYV